MLPPAVQRRAFTNAAEDATEAAGNPHAKRNAIPPEKPETIPPEDAPEAAGNPNAKRNAIPPEKPETIPPENAPEAAGNPNAKRNAIPPEKPETTPPEDARRNAPEDVKPTADAAQGWFLDVWKYLAGAGALVLVGFGYDYFGGAFFGLSRKSVKESAIRDCAVRTLAASSYALPAFHISKTPKKYVTRRVAMDELRVLFDTAENSNTFTVCIGAKACGKSSLIQLLASEAKVKDRRVVYLSVDESGVNGLKRQLVRAMGVSEMVADDASWARIKNLFITSLFTATANAKTPTVVVVDDLNRCRSAGVHDFLSVQGFLKDLCLEAGNVIVIGAVSSASDVAYMNGEPRRMYHVISEFTNAELAEYVEKRGFSREVTTEILNHFMPSIGYVSALLDKLPQGATKEDAEAAIAKRRLILTETCKPAREGLLAIKKQNYTVGTGDAAIIFGEDITRPSSAHFKLIEQNRVLVWNPTDASLSLKFPIQRDAVDGL